jgi:hypothetical protein
MTRVEPLGVEPLGVEPLGVEPLGVEGAAFVVAPYHPSHLRTLALQPHQQHLGAYLAESDHAETVLEAGPCWSVLVDDTPIACGGFQECWPGRSIAWAVLSDAAGAWMLPLTRAVRRGLREHPAERIEAQVLEGFHPGLRWATLLGFECEGRLRRFHEGRDYRAFALLKTSNH